TIVSKYCVTTLRLHFGVNVMKALLIIAFAITLSACSTDPVSFGKSKSIPSQNLYPDYAKFSRSNEGTVEVHIVRDRGIITGSVVLSIDGDAVASFDDSDGLVLHMQPGDYILTLERKLFLNPSTYYEREIVVKPGKKYNYRIFLENRLGLVSVSLMPSALLQ
ncbi:MAG: hypothetical protein ABI479_12385, partial [Gallionella sp.]